MDDDCPTCEKTHATLTIYRDDLDSDSVTRTLGVTPTASRSEESRALIDTE